MLRFTGVVSLSATLCLVVQPIVELLRLDSAWLAPVIGGCIFGLGTYAFVRFKSCWWQRDLAVAIGCFGLVAGSLTESRFESILGLISTAAIGSVVVLSVCLLVPVRKSSAT